MGGGEYGKGGAWKLCCNADVGDFIPLHQGSNLPQHS
jgi:hypothetical protein